MVKDVLKALAIVFVAILTGLGLSTAVLLTCLLSGYVSTDAIAFGLDSFVSTASYYGYGLGVTGVGATANAVRPHITRGISNWFAAIVTRRVEEMMSQPTSSVSK